MSVEVAANTLVAARIIEHKPAALRPLVAVKGDIQALLQRREAAALAVKDGEAKLAALVRAYAEKMTPVHLSPVRG